MEIQWHGYSCFTLKTKEGAVVVDPYSSKMGLKLPNLKANAVLLSDEEFPHNNPSAVADAPKLFTWPGEYEVSRIAITGIDISAPLSEKKNIQKAMIFTLNADNVTVCAISDLSVPLSEELMENIGEVDILLLPVGKGKVSYEKIHNLIEEIEPRIVIPVYYQVPGATAEVAELEPFLKKAGLSDVARKEKFSANSKSDLPQEKTEFVLLEPQVG